MLVEELIRKNADRMEWVKLSSQLNFNYCDDYLLEEFREKWDWNIISLQNLSEKQIERNIKLVDFYHLSYNPFLTYNLIRKYKEKLNWFLLCKTIYLSCDFIEEMKDWVDWNGISTCQNLSQEFIERWKDYVDWHYISRYQNLSEKFIVKHSHYVDWKLIFKFQNISEEFIAHYGSDGSFYPWIKENKHFL